MAVPLFVLPDVTSHSLSGFICKNLNPQEEEEVKSNLIRFMNVEEHNVTWFAGEAPVTPVVRCSTMKHLLGLFESYIHGDGAWRRLDEAIKLLANYSKLPSEIQEALAFLRDLAVNTEAFPLQSSGIEEGELRVMVASALLHLLKRSSLFEICSPRLEKEKADAAISLVRLLCKTPFIAQSSKAIVEVLQEISQSHSGEGLIDLMCKQSDYYAQAITGFNDAFNMGIQGSDPDLIGLRFNVQWFEPALFSRRVVFDEHTDWVFMAELLNRFLNTTVYKNIFHTGELDAFLCGKDENGGNVFIKIAVETGVISVRAQINGICEHVLNNINLVEEKMNINMVMNFMI